MKLLTLAANVFDGSVCGFLMPFGFLSHHLLHDGNDEPKTLS